MSKIKIMQDIITSIKIIYRFPGFISSNFINNKSREDFFLNIIEYYLRFDNFNHNSFDKLCKVGLREWLYSFLKKNMDNISNELSIKIIGKILKVMSNGYGKNIFSFSSLILFKSKIGIDGYIENSLIEPLFIFLTNNNEIINRDGYSENKKLDNLLIDDIETFFDEVTQRNLDSNRPIKKEIFQNIYVLLMSVCEKNKQLYYYNLIDQETQMNIFKVEQTDKKYLKNNINTIIKPLVEIGEFTFGLFGKYGFQFDIKIFKKLGQNKCIELYRVYCKIESHSEDFPIYAFENEIFGLDESLLKELEKPELIRTYQNSIIEILNHSSIGIDKLKEIFSNFEKFSLKKTIVQHNLEQFIVLLDINLIGSFIYANFKNELSNIINKRICDPITKKLEHVFNCCGNIVESKEPSKIVGNYIKQVEIPFFIFKYIVFFYLQQQQRNNDILSLSMVSKKTFTVVKDYINSISTSPIIEYKVIRKLVENSYQFSNFSVIDLKNLKSCKINFKDLSSLVKNIGLMESLAYIEIDLIYSKDWIEFKNDNNINHLKQQLGKEILIKIVDISNICEFNNSDPYGFCYDDNDDEYGNIYYQKKEAIENDDKHFSIYIENANNIDFSYISNLKINISSFLKIYKDNTSISKIKHLQINAPVCFDYNLAKNYLDQQKLIIQDDISDGGLEILEINLEHKRSIQRVLNIFENISKKLNTIIFNVLYNDSAISYSCLYSTIFSIISNNSNFSTVKSIIIKNYRNSPLLAKWDTVKYYSFNCLYPFDFRVFTSNESNQQPIKYAALSETECYGNDIKEIYKQHYYRDDDDSDYYDDGYQMNAYDCDGYDDLLHGD